jgi:hypothetical protein
MDPAQYVPLTPMSTRARYFAGVISPVAGLMAAYSPPIPVPAMNRRWRGSSARSQTAEEMRTATGTLSASVPHR